MEHGARDVFHHSYKCIDSHREGVTSVLLPSFEVEDFCVDKQFTTPTEYDVIFYYFIMISPCHLRWFVHFLLSSFSSYLLFYYSHSCETPPVRFCSRSSRHIVISSSVDETVHINKFTVVLNQYGYYVPEFTFPRHAPVVLERPMTDHRANELFALTEEVLKLETQKKLLEDVHRKQVEFEERQKRNNEVQKKIMLKEKNEVHNLKLFNQALLVRAGKAPAETLLTTGPNNDQITNALFNDYEMDGEFGDESTTSTNTRGGRSRANVGAGHILVNFQELAKQKTNNVCFFFPLFFFLLISLRYLLFALSSSSTLFCLPTSA